MSVKCLECEEGLAEWIMSYADMITILMAFFVVMYSMAGNKDNAKERAVLESLRNQFGTEAHGWGSLVPPVFQQYHSSQVDLPYQGGTKHKDKNHGGADQHRVPEGEHPRMHAPWPGEPSRVGGVIYFPTNDIELSEAQEKALKLIAADLGGKPQKIEVRGHTARRPSRNGPPEDGWNLAYERARGTMNYLIELGIDPQRFRLGVAGDNEPLPDSTGRSPYAQNSRVDVFMLNEVVGSQVPKQTPPGAAPGAKPESKKDAA